jgi:hypothetical protein
MMDKNTFQRELDELVTMLNSKGFGRYSISELIGCAESRIRRIMNRLQLKGTRIKNTEEYFWSLIKISDSNSCWEWVGALNNKGYGQFRFNGSVKFCHRLSYTLKIGDIPAGAQLCHKCDNPKCCNPNHLYVGNTSLNMIDRAIKGRQPNLILTPKKVKQIKELYKIHGPKRISEIMNVSIRNIKSVVYKETWKFID